MDKAPTGIEGLDDITGGGLPRGCTTLVMGGPGCGKTVLALQSLVNGARLYNEPGIFVAFEENSRSIIANAENFGWDLPDLEARQLVYFVDAQPMVEHIQAGSFDLQGMLAGLQVMVERMGARRIVFDSLDMLLGLLGDVVAERREVHRLQEWLSGRNLNTILTAKVHDAAGMDLGSFGFLQFMVDCALTLTQQVSGAARLRRLRVVKYRGSSFVESDCPLAIGSKGIEIASVSTPSLGCCSQERVSSGVEALDQMLNGGYFRCASVLISGSPGTAKTTLAGAFLEAACRRGEKALLVSFDSDPREVVRNLASVNVDLAVHVDSGMLHLKAARTTISSPEIHVLQIRALALKHNIRCIIVDPVSALVKDSNLDGATAVVERLVDWAKAQGITLLCTSLLGHLSAHAEGTPLHISTIADTWIHLSYLVHAGERNRALTIVKSRGTSHSNQVRELILSNQGITMTDVYSAGGEVFMGTMRWQQELAERDEEQRLMMQAKHKRLEMEAEHLALTRQLSALQRDLQLQEAALALLDSEELRRGRTQAEDARELLRQRVDQ